MLLTVRKVQYVSNNSKEPIGAEYRFRISAESVFRNFQTKHFDQSFKIKKFFS
jgi:hypothetical protein